MRFWDASALVPMLYQEATTAAMQGEYRRDPEMIVWWATDVECVSAISREERSRSLDAAIITEALVRLDGLAAAWQEVAPVAPIRRVAVRLLRVHRLRATDGLQLAAAITASENDPSSLPFVTLDERLAQAATREAFTVIRPGPLVSVRPTRCPVLGSCQERHRRGGSEFRLIGASG